FALAFRWLCSIEKQSVTNAVSANSLRFAQIYFFAMCLFYDSTCIMRQGGFSVSGLTRLSFYRMLCVRPFGNRATGK
uniref:hypothetical protein n=1 Tax=Alistipes putredinis TaxID=28117 RepID=UPI003FD833C3